MKNADETESMGGDGRRWREHGWGWRMQARTGAWVGMENHDERDGKSGEGKGGYARERELDRGWRIEMQQQGPHTPPPLLTPPHSTPCARAQAPNHPPALDKPEHIRVILTEHFWPRDDDTNGSKVEFRVSEKVGLVSTLLVMMAVESMSWRSPARIMIRSMEIYRHYVLNCKNALTTILKCLNEPRPLQSDDFLVVRRAPRIPFGLVLMLPFQWTTWIMFVSTLVLLVFAWILVQYRRFQISKTVFAALDIMEIILTGGTSRPMPWSSQQMAVIKYTEGGRIMLHKVEESFRSPSFGAYAVRQNHFIIHIINNLILRLSQSGLFNQWEHMLAYSLDLDGQRVRKTIGEDDGPEKLRVVQLTGPYLLWAGGLCLAGIATVLAAVELPRPWSITALVQAAHVPVMTAFNHTSRGYVHVVSIEARDFDPWLISRSFARIPRTNPLGIFIIVYTSTLGLTTDTIQNVHKAFFYVLGTTRVIQLFPEKYTPYVALSDTYDSLENEWLIESLWLSDFCEGQLNEHTRKVPLTSDVKQLKGLRYEYIPREQNMLLDRREITHFGGRDIMFSMLLTELGMKWIKSEDDTMFNKFRKETLELVLPTESLATFFNLSLLRCAEFTFKNNNFKCFLDHFPPVLIYESPESYEVFEKSTL
ncbi:Protein of unknown function [Gryllus bimaculatus]|nr:Protein of unknown function [Gryllus bimaculatus]